MSRPGLFHENVLMAEPENLVLALLRDMRGDVADIRENMSDIREKMRPRTISPTFARRCIRFAPTSPQIS